MSTPLAGGQSHVKIDVGYYDAAHQALLEGYAKSKEVAAVISKGYSAPIEQFLTYALFLKKDSGVSGFATYADLSRRVSSVESTFDGVVLFNGTSIHGEPARSVFPSPVPEIIGEATGLCVINEIHGIHGADWDRIPPIKIENKNVPRFDYRLASDGTDLIQVEVKGSCVPDNSLKPSAVSNHKAKIEVKKADIQTFENSGKYPFPCPIKYGTVGVCGQNSSSNLRCWLLDPPAIDVQLDARRVRLINRLRFLRNWIYSVGPRTQLSSAIANRVIAAEELTDPFSLSRVPLVRGSGEPLKFDSIPNAQGTYTWFQTRSRVIGEKAGGVVVECESGKLFFAGIQQSLVDFALSQDFEAIMQFDNVPRTVNRQVLCVVSPGRFQKMKHSKVIGNNWEESNGYVTFVASGSVHFSREGLAFGWLDT